MQDGRRCCVKEEGIWKSRSGEFTGSEHRPPTKTPQHKVFSGPRLSLSHTRPERLRPFPGRSGQKLLGMMINPVIPGKSAEYKRQCHITSAEQGEPWRGRGGAH